MTIDCLGAIVMGDLNVFAKSPIPSYLIRNRDHSRRCRQYGRTALVGNIYAIPVMDYSPIIASGGYDKIVA